MSRTLFSVCLSPIYCALRILGAICSVFRPFPKSNEVFKLSPFWCLQMFHNVCSRIETVPVWGKRIELHRVCSKIRSKIFAINIEGVLNLLHGHNSWWNAIERLSWFVMTVMFPYIQETMMDTKWNKDWLESPLLRKRCAMSRTERIATRGGRRSG